MSKAQNNNRRKQIMSEQPQNQNSECPMESSNIETMKKIDEHMQRQVKMEQAKKVKNFAQLNKDVQKGGILFTGSSLMEQFPICEMCMSAGIQKVVYNRGIGGFTTKDFLENIHVQLLDLKPSKVFINIGTNDMNPQFGPDWMKILLGNYRSILNQCKEHLPDTKVYLMAYYPVNDHLPEQPFYLTCMFQVRSNDNIALVNKEMAELAAEFGYEFIDINDGLTEEDGSLKAQYTIEGIHMYTDAYKLIFRSLQTYI